MTAVAEQVPIRDGKSVSADIPVSSSTTAGAEEEAVVRANEVEGSVKEEERDSLVENQKVKRRSLVDKIMGRNKSPSSSRRGTGTNEAEEEAVAMTAVDSKELVEALEEATTDAVVEEGVAASGASAPTEVTEVVGEEAEGGRRSLMDKLMCRNKSPSSSRSPSSQQSCRHSGSTAAADDAKQRSSVGATEEEEIATEVPADEMVMISSSGDNDGSIDDGSPASGAATNDVPEDEDEDLLMYVAQRRSEHEIVYI